MKKTMWIYTICVMVCALCMMGCNAKETPGSAGVETQKATTPAATDKVQHDNSKETAPEGVEATVEATLPEENENETNAPDNNSGDNQQPNQETQAPSDGKLTYEAYNAMTAEDQQAFYLSFSDPQNFFDWYTAAKEEHEKNNGSIIIGEDGVIDLEDLVG